MNMKQQAKKLKSDIPAIFIALKEKNTPLIAKIIAGVTVGYALSPIDLIPDFIPVLGYLDDVILLPALVALMIKLIPEEVWTRSKRNAEGLWKDGKPKKWYYSIPIISNHYCMGCVAVRYNQSHLVLIRDLLWPAAPRSSGRHYVLLFGQHLPCKI